MYPNDDISSYLAFEIKKELAEKYFGFRKFIEDNKEALSDRIKHHSTTVEQEICIDLGRIYALLEDNSLIEEFFKLIGLDMEHFYDPYLLESFYLKSGILFKNIKKHGITKSGRFNNLLFDSYSNLEKHIQQYREKYRELLDEEATIKEEISIFQRKHDIGTIIEFLRTIDGGQDTCSLGTEICQGSQETLHRKMKVRPPKPVVNELPLLPPIEPLPKIRKELKKLARNAFKEHGGNFTGKNAP